jgi:acetoacetyl-CoA synthetase
MGADALVARFGQLRPKVLLADGGERADEVARALGGAALVAPAELERTPAPERAWSRYAFNHPLFTLFSSGTTGRPKAIVHGAGGTLLEHVKEHRLHVDLRAADRLFFHTSAAWMMWNWQLSALASGAEIVLYDGPLAGPDTLWRIAASAGATVFGTSPPYLQLCQDTGLSPRREFALDGLRSVLSTGSILHDHQYDWVREHVGELPLQSISGGTDIIGCFVLGHPDRPVRRGWVQTRSLAMDVRALGATDSAPIGELVCANPFPSRPLGFAGDEGGAFHDAYFRQNPGVWTHGDLVELDGSGQARLHGRSDGVLNVRGIRIGPAEIHRALREVGEVAEALAVEQDGLDPGGSRIVLLVVLREPAVLDGRLTVRIRQAIARNASAAHVPDLVAAVGELPVTHSGKRSERAARDAVNGRGAPNTEALANPGALEAIRRAVAEAGEAQRRLAAAGDPGFGAPTETRVLAIFESVLGIAPLHADDNFFDVGGTSLAAVRVLEAIRDALGVELPVSTLLEAQTAAALAAVVDGPAEHRVPPLVLLRAGGAGRPVFVVHGIGGDVLHLRTLAQLLETDRPVYGIRARGLVGGAPPQTSVEEMADTYVGVVRSLQASGPYTLSGHSFGALVSYEMARRLRAAGEEVDPLLLVEPCVHHRCLPPVARARFVATRARRHRRAGLTPPPGPLARRLRPAPVTEGGAPLLGQLEEIGGEAFRAYRPSRYDGDVTAFLAEAGDPGLCEALGVWQGVVGGRLEVERVPGGHSEVVAEPHARALARRIAARL